MTVSPDGRSFAAGGGYRLMSGPDRKLTFKGKLVLGDLSADTVRIETSFPDVIGSLTYSPDGKIITAATDNRSNQTVESILIIDPDVGKERARLKGDAASIRLVAVAADGKTLYSLGSDKMLRTWDLRELNLLSAIEVRGHVGPGPGVHFAAISQDCRRLASCEMFGKVIVVTDVKSGQLVSEINIPDTLGNQLAISLDGRILASACQPISSTDSRFDEQIHFWDIETGQKLCSFDASTDGTVSTLCFLSDGKTLASGMDRGTTLLWNLSKVPPPH